MTRRGPDTNLDITRPTDDGLSYYPPLRPVPMGLLTVLAITYTIVLVALAASGRIPLTQGAVLLAVPVVLTLSALHPEWILLILVALPPTVVSPIPPLQMAALMAACLFGFVLQERLSLAPRTGIYPLIGIIVLAVVHEADVSSDAALAADATLKFLIYYALLMLVAFHSAAYGRLSADTVVHALLIGAIAAAVAHPFVAGTGLDGLTTSFVRTKFAYLAAIGLGVTYVRISLRRLQGHSPPSLDSSLMVVFFLLTAIGFGRASWIAVLVVFALVTRWTGRKTFWLILSVLFIAALAIPVVGERIAPGGSSGISDVTLARVTSGRTLLWEELYARAVDGLPFGNGWGYVWSLNSADIFGFEGAFGAEGTGYVYPHNDFLFMLTELGIPGLGLLIVLWLILIAKVGSLSRSRREQSRYNVRLLVPVIVMMLFVQLFDNGFATRFVAERFFVIAGLVFGFYYAGAERAPRRRLARTSLYQAR